MACVLHFRRCMSGRTIGKLSVIFVCICLTLLGSSSPASAKGGFLPPLTIDFGSTALSSDSRAGRTARLISASLNWATIYPKRTAFDIGIGYTAIFDAPDSEPDKIHSRTNSGFSMHGGFLSLSRLIGELAHTRAWIGTRVEMLRANGETVYGVSTRLSAEVWKGLALSGSNSGILGVGALGLWTEFGLRQLPNSGMLQHVSVGLSMRLPLFISS